MRPISNLLSIFVMLLVITLAISFIVSIFRISKNVLFFILSPAGLVILNIAIICIIIYFVSINIREKGFLGNVKALYCGEVKLWQAFWIYLFGVSSVFAKINEFFFSKTPQHAEFSAWVLVAVNVFVCYAAIASAIRQKKSFILFRGLAFFIAGIALVLNFFGVYVCVKDEIPLAEAIANPSDFYGIDQERIDAYKRGVEALTK